MRCSLSILAAAALLAISTAAYADARCAVVLKTPDGFLALREEPTIKSKIVDKLLRGNVIIVGNGHTGPCSGPKECSKTWRHVLSVAQTDGAYQGDKDYTEGWVARRYIQEFECPSQDFLGD